MIIILKELLHLGTNEEEQITNYNCIAINIESIYVISIKLLKVYVRNSYLEICTIYNLHNYIVFQMMKSAFEEKEEIGKKVKNITIQNSKSRLC